MEFSTQKKFAKRCGINEANRVFRYFLFIASLMMMSVPAQARELIRDQWHMITLPEQNFNIETFFTSGPAGDYGADWVLFAFNSETSSYRRVENGDLLTQGSTHWVIQAHDDSLKMSALSSAPSIPTLGCVESGNCTVDIPLTSNSWEMTGSLSPYHVGGRDFKIVDNMECDAGCSLGEWTAIKPDRRAAFRYLDREQGYVVIDDTVTLEPFEGFWVIDLDAVTDGSSTVLGLPNVPWRSELVPLEERQDPELFEQLNPVNGSVATTRAIYSELHKSLQMLMFAADSNSIDSASSAIDDALACLSYDDQASSRMEWHLLSAFGNTDQRRALLRSKLEKTILSSSPDQTPLCSVSEEGS